MQQQNKTNLMGFDTIEINLVIFCFVLGLFVGNAIAHLANDKKIHVAHTRPSTIPRLGS